MSLVEKAGNRERDRGVGFEGLHVVKINWKD